MALSKLPPWLLVLCLAAPLAAATTDSEIQALLNAVETSGCEFQRNGSLHDAADAADHLRLKYRRGGKYVDSAEQFIDRLATESSWTGKPYTIICDGVEEPTGAWLHRALAEQRASDRAQRPEAPVDEAT
jgi:hypothetical protein